MGKAPSVTRGPSRLYKAIMTRVTGSPRGQEEGSEGGQAAGLRAAKASQASGRFLAAPEKGRALRGDKAVCEPQPAA